MDCDTDVDSDIEFIIIDSDEEEIRTDSDDDSSGCETEEDLSESPLDASDLPRVQRPTGLFEGGMEVCGHGGHASCEHLGHDSLPDTGDLYHGSVGEDRKHN